MSVHHYDEHGNETLPPEESTALQRIDNPPPAIRREVEEVREITPAQARVESVALVLNSAYQNASKLTLTAEEAKALMADFDDSDIRSGARGDQNLIYLEHAAVRRRLMEVFGPGQWTIINRRSWLDESAGWLYADTVLVCRGCFVGECIGAMRYSAKNSRTNYADAVKGAESDALGRIAGTALGVGLKLWSKEFCDGWHQRQRQPQQRPTAQQAPRPQPAPKPAPQANQERPAATQSDVLPKVASEARRMQVWEIAARQAPPTDAPPLEGDGGTDLPTHIGETIISVPRKGMKRADYLGREDTIGSLYVAMKNGDIEAQKRLWGMAKNYVPESWVGNDGKKRPPSQADVDCRIGLDLFLEWHQQHGGSDDQP